MNDPNTVSMTCRYCQHYQPEGRRGGNCQRLNAMVQGGWQACSLAIPTFASAPETLQPLAIISQVKSTQPLVEYGSYAVAPIAYRGRNLRVARYE
jgi:hypothetical protein